MLWGVPDIAFFIGLHPNTILRAIRDGSLEAVERIWYRSRPDGTVLRRRAYGIPDWALRAWIGSKLLRRRADGRVWKKKPGRKSRAGR